MLLEGEIPDLMDQTQEDHLPDLEDKRGPVNLQNYGPRGAGYLLLLQDHSCVSVVIFAGETTSCITPRQKYGSMAPRHKVAGNSSTRPARNRVYPLIDVPQAGKL